MSRARFVGVIGPVFEHSAWVAALAWRKRPFSSRRALHRALCESVAGVGPATKLKLICAHPDLVGRAALAGRLTVASAREQAGAGLDTLTPEEVSLFQRQNRAYRARFGFPFVICARLNKKAAILKGFRMRLKHSRAEEIRTALAEVARIARLRLEDIVRT